MKILLDTQILIWLSLDRLPQLAIDYILNESNTIYFSAASIWEITIKRGLGRADFNVDPHILYNSLLENLYEELSITPKHTVLTGALPMIHKDPFDRVLLAQAITEGMSLLTTDNVMAQYPAPVILIDRMGK